MNEIYDDRVEQKNFFSGNLYFFYSFDIGDDIDLKKVYNKHKFAQTGTFQSQFFRSHNKPLVFDLSKLLLSDYAVSARIYNFGVLSLRYQYSFNTSFEVVRKLINKCENECAKNSINDARVLFNFLREDIRVARFFHLSKSYCLIQVNPKENCSAFTFKDKYGNEIVSVLRFENESLSSAKKNEILSDSLGYYHGDLLIIDSDSALMYDDDYFDILDIFEFGNIRHMELQYFDKALDKQLNFVYERQPYKIPRLAYIPLFGMFRFDPMGELAKLRVDIAVVSERLWNSIKFSNDQYYLEIYEVISKKFDFDGWQESIDKKLGVIKDILEVHENRVSTIRYDVFNVLIVILIFIECTMAIFEYARH